MYSCYNSRMPGSAVARRHLDRRLAMFRGADVARPPRGWIRAVRDALGMSSTELAAQMGVSQSRIPAIERAEVSGSIRLGTLERAASALDCRLVYVLVPNRPLEDSVQAQARRKATRHLAEVAHNMRLEDQAVTDADLAAQIDELASRLVDRRGLWAEDGA